MKQIFGREGARREKLLGAAVIAGLGIGTVIETASYPMGSLRQIGPGAVPMSLGIILTLLGIAFYLEPEENAEWMPSLALRPLIAIAAAMIAFAILVEISGMFAAIIGLVAISEFAERDYHWKKVLLSSAGLCLFIAGLKYLLSDSLILDLY